MAKRQGIIALLPFTLNKILDGDHLCIICENVLFYLLVAKIQKNLQKKYFCVDIENIVKIW